MLLRFVLSVLLLLTPTLASACGPFPFRPFYSPPVVKEVVVEKEIVPVFATIFVPSYGVGYPVPPPQPAAAAPVAPPIGSTTSCEQRAADLERRLADLERRLAGAGPAAPGGNPPAVAPASPPAPGQAQATAPAGKDAVSIFAARCYSCHGDYVAKDKGGGFTLMLGRERMAPLTDRQLRKIGTLTYNQQMPKGGPPLSDEEVSTIQGWLNSQK